MESPNPFTNPSGDGWSDFLNNVVNATTRIIQVARNPNGTTTTGTTGLVVPTPAAGAASMTGLLVLAVLVIVVMKA